MARSGSSFGFLDRFGRSHDLRSLDAAFRAADLHPSLVPEGVKLAVVNLMKNHHPDGDPPAEAYPPVGAFFCFCLIGPENFAGANGVEAAEAELMRLERAIDSGEGLEAELVLLAIHSKLINPALRETYDLKATE